MLRVGITCTNSDCIRGYPVPLGTASPAVEQPVVEYRASGQFCRAHGEIRMHGGQLFSCLFVLSISGRDCKNIRHRAMCQPTKQQVRCGL